MPPQLPRYLSLAALAARTEIDRGAIERMISRGLVHADALLAYGTTWIPLFTEARAAEVLITRMKISGDDVAGRLPTARPDMVPLTVQLGITPQP
jgi:hypothetical protein